MKYYEKLQNSAKIMYKLLLFRLLLFACAHGMELQDQLPNSGKKLLSLQELALRASLDDIRALKKGHQLSFKAAFNLNRVPVDYHTIFLKELLRDTAVLQGVLPFFCDIKESPDKTKLLVNRTPIGGYMGTLHIFDAHTLKESCSIATIGKSFICDFGWSAQGNYIYALHSAELPPTLSYTIVDLQHPDKSKTLDTIEYLIFTHNDNQIVTVKNNEVALFDLKKHEILTSTQLPETSRGLEQISPRNDLFCVTGTHKNYIVQLPSQASRSWQHQALPLGKVVSNFDCSILLIYSGNTLHCHHRNSTTSDTESNFNQDIYDVQPSSINNKVLINLETIWDIEQQQCISHKTRNKNEVFKFNKALDTIYSLTSIDSTTSALSIKSLNEKVIKKWEFNEPFKELQVHDDENHVLLSGSIYRRALVVNLHNNSSAGVATASDCYMKPCFINNETVSLYNVREPETFIWKINTIPQDIAQDLTLSELLAYFILKNNHAKNVSKCLVAKKVIQESSNSHLKMLLEKILEKK